MVRKYEEVDVCKIDRLIFGWGEIGHEIPTTLEFLKLGLLN